MTTTAMFTIRSSAFRMLGKNKPFHPRATFSNAGATYKAVRQPPPQPNHRSCDPETIWYERCREVEEKWYHRYKELSDELLEKCDTVAKLRSIALHNKTEMLKLKENFNIRGALERTVYQARLTGKIGSSIGAGVQAGINELAKTAEFDKVFKAEVGKRGLVHKDVAQCVALVYHETSKFAHGNDSMITIRERDHTENERAALAIILMVQKEWPDSIAFCELMEEK